MPAQVHESHDRLPLEEAARYIRTKRTTRARILIALFFGDILALAVAFAIANFLIYGTEDTQQYLTIVSVSIPLMVGFGLHDGAYGSRTGIDPRTSIFRVLKALVLTSAALMLVAFLLKVGAGFSRAQFVIGTGLAAILLCVFRFGIARTSAGTGMRGLFADLHIYDGGNVAPRVSDDGHFSLDARLTGLIPDLGNSVAINRLGMIARGMDSVVVHCPPETRSRWADALRTLDVPTEIVVPELDDLNALKIASRDGKTTVLLSDGRLTWDQAILKRAFDLVLVVPTIPLLLIVFVIVGIIIKLDNPGPVFFRQDRIGVGNRVFKIWKFRSMKVALQDATASKLTLRNDDRVTRVGRFIRKTSIDELPQLLNVLLGDMSLVGPRPHAAMARAGDLLYWEVDQAYWERHVVKPGITGLAQVRGFRGNTFEEDNLRDRLQADLEYVANWSLLLDVKILCGTVLVPFHKNAF
jgi:polysaccharide biosynthesis protein PslA